MSIYEISTHLAHLVRHTTDFTKFIRDDDFWTIAGSNGPMVLSRTWLLRTPQKKRGSFPLRGFCGRPGGAARKHGGTAAARGVSPVWWMEHSPRVAVGGPGVARMRSSKSSISQVRRTPQTRSSKSFELFEERVWGVFREFFTTTRILSHNRATDRKRSSGKQTVYRSSRV